METRALEAFVRFAVRLMGRAAFVLHRDHWDKDFRAAIELCEVLGIAGVERVAELEKKSQELAEKTDCDKRHASIFPRLARSVFGCVFCNELSRSVCVARKAGAFLPANVPDQSGADKAKH